jgi:putative membrane protein
MSVAAKVIVVVVALEHAWFLVLEMLLWTKPIGMRTFRTSVEHARATAALAANQGLYNGFLAAGLVWGLAGPAEQAAARTLFFLVCVLVAGIFGALTVSRRILLVQGLPALLALILVVLSGGPR